MPDIRSIELEDGDALVEAYHFWHTERGIEERVARFLARTAEIPRTKIGRRYYARRSALEEYWQARMAEVPAA